MDINTARKQGANRPLICGHRGASGHAPENTMAAFHEALETGADWIEFDIQLSADNQLVVLHDDTLKRTTDLEQPRRPVELELKEIRELDAGSWFGPEFAGEKIPTLDEVIEEFMGKLGLNIEIKSRPGFETDNGIEANVSETLKRHNLFNIERVIVSSFDPNRLAALHTLNEKIPIGALYKPENYPRNFDPFSLLAKTGASALHPQFKAVSQELVERAHKQGVMVNTWTVNETVDLQRMVELRLDIVITNYPALLREVIENRAAGVKPE